MNLFMMVTSTLKYFSFIKPPSGLYEGGARGVIVIIVGNEHGDTSSKPG